MNGRGTDIWNNADQFRFVHRSLRGDGSIVARVERIGVSHGWALAGVMIRESLDAGSRHALVAMTQSYGVTFARRSSTNGTSQSVEQIGLQAPYWVKLTRTGNRFTAERSEDGIDWVGITNKAGESVVTLSISTDAYIGLAVTSHNTMIPTDVEFSHITTTGNTTDDWQAAGIGCKQLEGNAPEPLYVTLEDGAGKSVTVTHPDALAILRPAWYQWEIPFQDLTGIDLTRVKRLSIGVGSHSDPVPGGAGLIYIDDIAFGRPRGTP
jgi:hypothetical protein